MAYRNDWIQLIRRLAQRYGVDPRAALAVASTEGLSGGVGDNGHAFGPFQLNDSGGVITGRPGNHRAFAESPQGIEWAIRQLAGVSKGLTGPSAVKAIVSRFERPADIPGEISNATSRLSQFGGNTVAPQGPQAPALPPPRGAAAPAPETTGPDFRTVIARQVMSGKQIDFVSLARTMMQQRAAQPKAAAPAPSSAPPGNPAATRAGGSGSTHGALAEAFYDPIGQWDNGRFSTKGIGGHSDHVHLSITNPKAMLAAIAHARQVGLRVGENPYVDPVDPVHVKGSFHYRDFPGKYNGRRLGEAIDVSGNSKAMAAYFRWALANLR